MADIDSNHKSSDSIFSLPQSVTTVTSLLSGLEVLKNKSDSIESKLCSALGKADLLYVSPNDIKSSNKIGKLSLGEDILSFIKLITDVCVSNNINFIKSSVSNTSEIRELTSSIKEDLEKLSHDQNLVTDIEKYLKLNSESLTSITSEINNLKSYVQSLDAIKMSTVYMPSEFESTVTEPPSSQVDVNITASDILCYEDYKNDFLCDGATLSELKQYLSKECLFSEENGHSVSAFGERYSYTGSKSTTKTDTPIPGVINKIVDKINTDFKCNVNSVLVNKYTGKDSYLPKHSDDEASIDPESCIYTLSLGETRTLVFSNKYTEVESKLSVETNSLYIMSRQSQNHFAHKIDKEVVPENSTRYSLTFRCVGNKFRRSTIIIGDSLSSNFKFGEGQGTFGRGLPGTVVKASKLADIRPTDCLSYSNVVIQCGINDLRKGNNQRVAAASTIFNVLKEKVTTILKLKENINIFISPILPTRLVHYNQRVVTFNRLIRSQIIDQHYRCSLLDVSSFCDATYRTDLLDSSFCRSEGDPVHLNSLGTRKLAGIIRKAIFLKYNSRKGGRISSTRPYASAVSDGRQWPRLTGTPQP